MPKTIQHTQSRLTYRETGDANCYMVLDDNGNWLLNLIHNGGQLPAKQAENMRRFVACWNACDGIETAQLEESASLVGPWKTPENPTMRMQRMWRKAVEQHRQEESQRYLAFQKHAHKRAEQLMFAMTTKGQLLEALEQIERLSSDTYGLLVDGRGMPGSTKVRASWLQKLVDVRAMPGDIARAAIAKAEGGAA